VYLGHLQKEEADKKFKNSELGELIEPQKEEVTGTGENFIRRSFMYP
jgi:hypothetical protein